MSEFAFEEWLMAQWSRTDLIGNLANLYLQSKPDNFSTWLEERRAGSILGPAISDAELEYQEALTAITNCAPSKTFLRLFLRPHFQQTLQTSFSIHHTHSHITADQYLHQLHEQLHAYLRPKNLIYLDTCHWIKLRHVILGHNNATPEYEKLLKRLLKLTQAGKIACPISFPLFVELMKQTSRDTCLATAKLMDELSLGICLQTPDQILQIEVHAYLAQSVHRDRAADISSWKWTKAGFISKEVLPEYSGFDERTQEFIKKLWIDTQWSMKLEDIVHSIAPGEFPHLDDVTYARAFNIDSLHYRTNGMTFKEIRDQELAFCFRRIRPFLEESMKEIYKKYPLECNNSINLPPLHDRPDLMLFPSIQIEAAINTSFITSTANFKPNDVADAQHAALALPYYNIFFCDRPLAHRLTNKPLALDVEYDTCVVSDASTLHTMLSDL